MKLCGTSARLAVWGILPVLGVSGCLSASLDRMGEAKGIVATSLAQMGGYDAWARVGGVDVTAVVKVYDADGTAHVSRQQQVIDVNACRIQATAQTGQGSWRAGVDRNGRCHVKVKGLSGDAGLSARVCRALDLIRRRAGGTLSLLGCRKGARLVGPVTFGGETVVQVDAVEADGTGASYYFLPTTGELRFLAASPRAGEGKGTVTIYTYGMTDNGMTFPRQIRVVEAGENVSIGQQPILEVEFTRVEIH